MTPVNIRTIMKLGLVAVAAICLIEACFVDRQPAEAATLKTKDLSATKPSYIGELKIQGDTIPKLSPAAKQIIATTSKTADDVTDLKGIAATMSKTLQKVEETSKDNATNREIQSKKDAVILDYLKAYEKTQKEGNKAIVDSFITFFLGLFVCFKVI